MACALINRPQAHRHSAAALPIIFRIVLHGDTPEQTEIFDTCTKNLQVVLLLKLLICMGTIERSAQDETSWGFSNLISMNTVVERADAFRARSAADEGSPVVDQSDGTSPQAAISIPAAGGASPYRLRGVLVIRYVSATAWEKASADMTKSPSKYLFLDISVKPAVLPIDPSALSVRTLEESMLALLRDADTDGDVVFIVGGGAGTRVRAHSNIVRMATPVKIFHEETMEGRTKEVRLKHMPIKVSRRFSGGACLNPESCLQSGLSPLPRLHVHADDCGRGPARSRGGAHGGCERVPDAAAA
jgi:hypothetical protein